MKLREKSEYINHLLLDLRAEFMVSCLLEDGVNANQILASFDGNLKRKWTSDIDFSELETFENNKDALCIHLNRAGIYDSLPEALFHSTIDNRNATGENMAKDSMRLKTEEKQTRLFFKPFENEIFLQNVSLTCNENELFQNLFADTLNGLVPGFWKIDKRIPELYSTRLVKILPYAHKIVGNLILTAEALEFILDEPVHVELDFNAPNEFISTENDLSGNKLGDGLLGQDFIMGHTVTGFIGQIIFQIGPLCNTAPMDYYEGGPANHLLNTFIGYFTPMEYDAKTQLLLEKEKSQFFLSKNEEGAEASNLGFNTVL